MPTLSVNYIQMQNNRVLPGCFSAELTPEQPPINLTAPELALTNPAPPPDFIPFRPLFWNISGPGNRLTIGTNATASIHDEDVNATAWYYPVGGTSAPVIVLFTFSETNNLFLPDNPIDSITATGYDPANPMWVPTSGGDVRITPKASIGGEPFDQWLIFGPATVFGDELHEVAGQGDWAIACYKGHTLHPPYPYTHWDLSEILHIIPVLPDIGDPASIELYRWIEKVTGQPVPAEHGQVDVLENLTRNVETMRITELRTTLAVLKAQTTRLSAAQKMVETELLQR